MRARQTVPRPGRKLEPGKLQAAPLARNPVLLPFIQGSREPGGLSIGRADPAPSVQRRWGPVLAARVTSSGGLGTGAWDPGSVSRSGVLGSPLARWPPSWLTAGGWLSHLRFQANPVPGVR